MSDIFIDEFSGITKFIERVINGNPTLIETEEWKNYKQSKLLSLSLKKSGIPEIALSIELDDLKLGLNSEDKISAIKQYIYYFSTHNKNSSLYLWSTRNGTQKTTTASIIGKELIKKGFSCKFILMSDLSKLLLNESFSEEDKMEIDALFRVDFLIIDDSFDPKKVTIYKSGYQISFLDSFLRKRMESLGKTICFTSNFKEIDEKIFGISLKSLIDREVKKLEFKIPYKGITSSFDIDKIFDTE